MSQQGAVSHPVVTIGVGSMGHRVVHELGDTARAQEATHAFATASMAKGSIASKKNFVRCGRCITKI